ncbi:MAG TPA: hypothetical protein DCW74_08225 [Alteromonas australica]|jgi:hypothetical protein|uniref:Uncharacterized protein n=1 Tax=Alteromonas australica TaxID=589873 RepID=A0A350P338_9ALTE|nr:hypothetical protein [Alteromonas australica]|tara:strand:+ start:1379 stop:1603 length:225 start_codon:yes stop_codon:yes gene_type:complete
MNKPFEFMLDYFNRKLDISNSQLIRSEEIKKKAIVRLSDVVMQTMADIPEKEMTNDMKDALRDARLFLNQNIHS